MAYYQNLFRIIDTKPLNTSCCSMVINCPEITAEAHAGQFLHILCSGKTLRRPISICEIDKLNGSLRIVFDVRGEGTRWLSKRCQGEYLDILGPLGNGFDLTYINKDVLLVGGGMGVPPLLEAAKAYNGRADTILGFKCEDNSILLQDFEKVCRQVFLTSDDGSCGERGFVTDVLLKRINTVKYDLILTCGPNMMLRAVSEIAKEQGIDCYVSMEERMGCGVGACLVCACKTKDGGKETYKHVCKDGPVFNANEVVW